MPKSQISQVAVIQMPFLFLQVSWLPDNPVEAQFCYGDHP